MTDGIDLSLDHLFSPLSVGLNDVLPRIPSALVILLAGIFVIRLLSWTGSWLLGFIRLPRGLKQIIIGLMDALLTVFLVIVVLQALGLNNLAFIFSAAVAAIGLAVGNSSAVLVGDVLGGVQLAKDRDFSVGDEVRIADKPGDVNIEGVIEAMDIRRTRIRDKEGHLHVFPNSYIDRREWVLLAKKRDRKA